ncbi:M48 family metallopeptidase [Deinococcus aquatilis]|jgi:Zn-dependent protease with chaperone function|uniref:M48 family metallopeptidase n=1 Tax=Deinococcus aquatilis TaxID=519440 RepID=UPI00037DE228|nr:M48 family metallopeptidase [Deinococcus aquatilis]
MNGKSGESLSTVEVEGIYFDGRSSRDRAARLTVQGDQVTVQTSADGVSGGTEARWPLARVSIDPPLPGVRRVLKFPDRTRFETEDDAAIRAIERRARRTRPLSDRMLGGVRQLEGSWGLTFAALGLMGAFVWGFIAFGLPAIARGAAAATPSRVLTTFDRETVDLLDKPPYLGPSKLSAARQAELQRGFRQVVGWAGGAYSYRLLLRDGEPEDDGNGSFGGFSLGANAFALPGGTVVMTDQLVALARSDRELLGVLAHESGHVTHRHGLAGVYQALGLTLLTTVVTGDLVSAGTFAAAAPAALLQRGYSRAAETQADEVAGAFMLEKYRTTRPLRDILARLENKDAKADESSVQSGNRIEDLLQSHPGTANRIEHLRALEQAAK